MIQRLLFFQAVTESLHQWVARVRQLASHPPSVRQVIGRMSRSKVVSGTLLGWAARIFQMAFQVLSVRLVMEALGTNGYAGVVLLSGLSAWLNQLDFGFSNGFLNSVAVAKAKGQDDNGLKLYALLCYLGFSIVGIVVALVIPPLVADSFLAAVAYGNRTELMTVAVIILAMVGTGAIGNRILLAEQRITLFYGLSLLATVASTIGLILMHWGVVPFRVDTVIAVMYVPQALGGLAAVIISTRGIKRVLPTAAEAWAVFVVSAKFLGLNLLTIMTVGTDTFVISQCLSARDISVYGIYSKLFNSMNLLITTPLWILWPRFSMHAARGERGVLKQLLQSFVMVSVGMMIAFGFFIYFFGPWVTNILAPGQNIVAPYWFVLALTLLQVSILWTGSFHTALLSMSVLGPALLLTPVQAVISATAEWFFAKWFGVVGVTGGMLLSYLILPVWFAPMYLWIVMRRQKRAAPGNA